MLKKKIMAYVHQLLDQPSQWQTSQQAGPCSVPKFTSTSITVKHLLIKNKNINQSKSSLLIWHYVSYLFLLCQTSRQLKVGMSDITMKLTWFAVSFPTGKLGFAKNFNNCFVYAQFFFPLYEKL